MESLLEHLGAIQHAAQLVAASGESVEKLVEETYRRAAATRRAGDDRPDRQLLLAELGRLQADLATSEAHSVAELAAAGARASAALEHAKSAVHQVLSGLESDDWSILFLSEVDSLSSEELAAFLGENPEELTVRMQELHTQIHEHLLTEASPSMRVALLESLPEDWLRTALSGISEGLPEPSEGLRARISASTGPQNLSPKPKLAPPQVATKTPEDRPRRTGIRPVSILIGAVLILVIGFGADYLHSVLSQEPERDLIVLTARNAGVFRYDLETQSIERAERFLHTHSGLQPAVPRIDGATIGGVGMEELAPAVHAPAIRYTDDTSGRPITVYSLSYKFLDDNPSVTLSADVRRQIQGDANFDLHSLGSADVLVWRDRSAIFLAVTEIGGRELEKRIVAP